MSFRNVTKACSIVMAFMLLFFSVDVQAETSADIYPPVAGITLNPNPLNLVLGEPDGMLTAVILPPDATNKNVSWLSSNPGVATVSNGIVHAVGEGTAVVWTAAEDGNRKAFAIVKVKSRDLTPPVTRQWLTPIMASSSKGRLYISGFFVTLLARDTESGVSDTQVRINGGTWESYKGPFAIYAATTHTLEYFSTDKQGNVEPLNVMDFDAGTFIGSK